MAARHAAVAAQAARSRGRGHVTKGGVRWGAAGTGHGGLLAGRRRFVRKGRDVGEHWALGVSGSAGAHWFSQPRAGLAGAARRGAWADAPLREVGQKRPPCRHARPDLPPRAAPRVSTPLGCCAAAPARVAGAPMQRREVEPRACRPPARCAAGERGGRGGERLQCFLRRRVLSHASRTALSPPRSAPAPGGTPATFPSGVSATPPPARAIRPPAPSLRAGGWRGGATNGSNLLVARVRGEGGLKGRLMDEQARALAQRHERLARPRIARAHHAPSARSGLRRGAEQHARGVAARMPHLHRADRHAEPRGLLRARPALRPPRAPRRAATSCVGCTVWDAGFGFGFKVWERGGAPPCH
jgi:hypothetical protein